MSSSKEDRIRELEEEIKRLHKENSQLQEEKEFIEKEKEFIEKEKEFIEKEKESIEKKFEQTKKEFEEFKAVHGVTVDHLRRAMHIKPERTRSGKAIGAQKNHKGYSRRIPERIDYVKSLHIDHCPCCNTILRGKVIRKRSRTVTDIRLLTSAETTQYDLHGKWCPACKKIVDPIVPGALPGARFGIHLMLLVMYLRLGLRLPGNKVCEYFATLHDITISEGEVVNILRLLANEYGSHYATLEQLVRLARVKHTDSTGWRINGKNYFAWVFIAAGVVLYKIRKRNNHKVPLGVLGRARQGDTLVVDRHSAFRTLAKKAKFLLQLCWSHILEDSRELKKNFGSEGHYVHKKLKAIYNDAKMLNHAATPEQVEQLKGMIIELTQRHYTHTTIRRFVTTLATRDLEDLFRFTTDPEIDPTNNISERELRAIVIIRKISNGSKSTRGANTTAILLSIIQTFRLNKENPLTGLKRVLSIS